MGDLQFTAAAQQWVNVVLVWIGLGTLAGLLARAVFPSRDPAGAVATLVVGVAGSALGLWVLSLAAARWYGNQPLNPISPLGLLSAAGGAFLLLVCYRLAASTARSSRSEEDAEP